MQQASPLRNHSDFVDAVHSMHMCAYARARRESFRTVLVDNTSLLVRSFSNALKDAFPFLASNGIPQY